MSPEISVRKPLVTFYRLPEEFIAAAAAFATGMQLESHTTVELGTLAGFSRRAIHLFFPSACVGEVSSLRRQGLSRIAVISEARPAWLPDFLAQDGTAALRWPQSLENLKQQLTLLFGLSFPISPTPSDNGGDHKQEEGTSD